MRNEKEKQSEALWMRINETSKHKDDLEKNSQVKKLELKILQESSAPLSENEKITKSELEVSLKTTICHLTEEIEKTQTECDDLKNHYEKLINEQKDDIQKQCDLQKAKIQTLLEAYNREGLSNEEKKQIKEQLQTERGILSELYLERSALSENDIQRKLDEVKLCLIPDIQNNINVIQTDMQSTNEPFF